MTPQIIIQTMDIGSENDSGGKIMTRKEERGIEEALNAFELIFCVKKLWSLCFLLSQQIVIVI